MPSRLIYEPTAGAVPSSSETIPDEDTPIKHMPRVPSVFLYAMNRKDSIGLKYLGSVMI